MAFEHFLGTLRIAVVAILGVACSSHTPDTAGQGGAVGSGGGSTGSGGQLGSGGVSQVGAGGAGPAVDAGAAGAGGQCEATMAIDPSSTSIAGTWDFTPAGGSKRTIQVPGGGWLKQGINASSGTYATQVTIPDSGAAQTTLIEFGAVNTTVSTTGVRVTPTTRFQASSRPRPRTSAGRKPCEITRG